MCIRDRICTTQNLKFVGSLHLCTNTVTYDVILMYRMISIIDKAPNRRMSVTEDKHIGLHNYTCRPIHSLHDIFIRMLISPDTLRLIDRIMISTPK